MNLRDIIFGEERTIEDYIQSGVRQSTRMDVLGYDLVLRNSANHAPNGEFINPILQLVSIGRKDGHGTNKYKDRENRSPKGNFTKLISILEKMAIKHQLNGVYVEQVAPDHWLEQWLLENGYERVWSTELRNLGIPPSNNDYCKLLPDK